MGNETLYQGETLTCKWIDSSFAEICFDHKHSSVNKFDRSTLTDLDAALSALEATKNLKGVLLSSAKDGFIVGADITEFLKHFQLSNDELMGWLSKTHDIFNRLEDLPVPSVSAINGICLGGGFEVTLATTYRVVSDRARVGLPEVKLGLYPGWGGTIRLSRLIGADNAIEWIATGKSYKATEALPVGAVDAVVPGEALKNSALTLLQRAVDGTLNWQQRRQEKIDPLKLRSPIEAAMVFEGAKGFVGAKAGPNYPAPVTAIDAMQKGASLSRNDAETIEASGFVKVAKLPSTECLVTIFLADQFNKKKGKKATEGASKVNQAAVLGAGIMGGGIAYQSATTGTPIVMKDLSEDALNLGMKEATKLLTKQIERKKLTPEKMAHAVAAITPTTNYSDFKSVQFVVEAIIENTEIKKSVLSELENQVEPTTIIASNTSTICIDTLAEGLQRPDQFVGMHFFNPVHRMPLVEIIRGKKTGAKAIATAVQYAFKMGKTPVVVNDCPGFLVNRILFPYFTGLIGLIEDGVPFQKVDKVMERFGWPMGPAYLLDVVGIDTAVHAADVMGKAFPDRMNFQQHNVMDVLKEANRFGQKNGVGFYAYEIDKKGKPKKVSDSATEALIKPLIKRSKSVEDEEIVDRMMIPMANEAARCLAEGIVATPMELDLSLIYGIGFPPFRGGALKYTDQMGLSSFLEKTKRYSELGAGYEAAPMISELCQKQQCFYQN